MRIGTKLIVAFCLFGVVPALLAGGYGARQAFVLLQEAVQRRLEAEVGLQGQGIQRLLQDLTRDVRFLSRLPTLRALIELPAADLAATHPLARPVGEALASFAASRPVYYQLRYLDQRGREIVRVDAGPRGPALVPATALQDKGDRYYFREAMATTGALYVSPMDLNVERGNVEVPLTPVIRYAERLTNSRDETRGLVIVNVHAEHILGQVLALRRGKEETVLLDSTGRVLAGAEGAEAAGLVVPGKSGRPAVSTPAAGPVPLTAAVLAPGLAAVLSTQPGSVVEPGLQGRILAFAPIFPRPGGRDHWILAAAYRKTEVLASTRSFQVLVVVLGMGVLVVAVFAGTAAARHFTRPIAELIRGANAMAAGGFDRPLRVDTRDELEDLARQFSHMALRLKGQQQALTEARERAERKAREAQALSRIATEMLGLPALPQILQAVVDHARELLRADLAFLSLDAPGGERRLEAASGDAAALHRELGASVGDLNCPGVACETVGCPMVSPASQASRVSVPVHDGRRILGYLCAGFRSRRLVTTDERAVLAGLANQAAIAIETARLHQEVRALERLEERERIAADLHDGVIQSIYATGLGLEEGLRLLPADQPGVRAKVDQAIGRLNEVIRDVRNYVVGLLPESLQDRGLSHAVTELVRELEVNGLLRAELRTDPAVDALLTPVQTGELFHIAREALTNVVKHAGATTTRVALERTNGRIRLRVEDDGCGFDRAVVSGAGRGLGNIAERTRRLGGRLEVDSHSGRGTRLAVDVPVGRQT